MPEKKEDKKNQTTTNINHRTIDLRILSNTSFVNTSGKVIRQLLHITKKSEKNWPKYFDNFQIDPQLMTSVFMTQLDRNQ